MPAQPDDLQVRRARLANRFAWGVGVLIVLVAAAGSDHPLPPGFLLIVALVAAAGWAVRRGLPVLLGVWDSRGSATALAIAGGCGLALGVGAWAALTAVQVVTRSAPLPPSASLVLGLVVVAGHGLVGALVLAILVRLLDRRGSRRR